MLIPLAAAMGNLFSCVLGSLNCPTRLKTASESIWLKVFVLFVCLLVFLLSLFLEQLTPTWRQTTALTTRAATARSPWRTCCPPSSLSLEPSGEAPPTPSIKPEDVCCRAAKVVCQQAPDCGRLPPHKPPWLNVLRGLQRHRDIFLLLMYGLFFRSS